MFVVGVGDSRVGLLQRDAVISPAGGPRDAVRLSAATGTSPRSGFRLLQQEASALTACSRSEYCAARRLVRSRR